MDLMPSEEQLEIQRSVRSFLSAELPMERVRAIQSGDPAPLAEVWRKAGDLGFFGLGLSPSEGGAGFSLTEEMILFEELGRALAPGPWLGTVIAAHALSLETDPVRVEARQRILAGDLRVALIERPEGSLLEFVEGRLTGERSAVADALGAGALLILDPVGIFYIPCDGPGAAIEPRPSMDPSRPIARVRLRDTRCEVLTDNAAMSEALRRAATVLACAEAVGSLERTVEMSVEYVKVREQFGVPIGTFQAVKHRCADMAVRAEVARSVTTYAAIAVRDGVRDEAFFVSAAKALCGSALLQNAADNVQNHGGMGFTWECDAHLFVKRARSFDLLFGTRTQHLDAIVSRLRAA